MSDHARTSEYVEREEERTGDGDDTGTLLNGTVGGVAGVLLSFLPFSAVLGGAIAGYLEAGRIRDGARVGTVAGAVAVVPYLVATWALLTLDVALPGPDVPTGVFLGVVAAFLAVYVLGASVVGGVLGSWLRRSGSS